MESQAIFEIFLSSKKIKRQVLFINRVLGDVQIDKTRKDDCYNEK